MSLTALGTSLCGNLDVPVGLVVVDGSGEDGVVGDGSPGEVAKADIFLGSNRLFS
jgi:hypothetical protein